MRQLHILFNSAKTWHVIVCWFLCYAPNLPVLNQKLFWTSEQNNFRLSSGKFGAKRRNQQTINCQVLAELNKIWSCLIFIKLYQLWNQKALWHHCTTTKVFIGFFESSFQILSHFFVVFFCFYSRCRDWGEKIKEILNAYLKTNMIFVTDKSLLEAPIDASTIPQYDKILLLIYMKSSEHFVYINCSECQIKNN